MDFNRKKGENMNRVEQAIEDIRQGKIIIVTDNEERENEGDLICAAEFATPENVNFMAKYAKGLICMPMSKNVCEKLGLKPMLETNTDNHQTAFMTSIDYKDTKTGISAYERSETAIKAVEERNNRIRLQKTRAHVSTRSKRKWSIRKRWTYRGNSRYSKTCRT